MANIGQPVKTYEIVPLQEPVPQEPLEMPVEEPERELVPVGPDEEEERWNS